MDTLHFLIPLISCLIQVVEIISKEGGYPNSFEERDSAEGIPLVTEAITKHHKNLMTPNLIVQTVLSESTTTKSDMDTEMPEEQKSATLKEIHHARSAFIGISLCKCMSMWLAALISRILSVEKACVLDLNIDLPMKHEPLFLQRTSGSLKLLFPVMEGKRGVVKLETAEKIIISCPGKNNHIVNINTKMSEASCKERTKLIVEGAVYCAKNLNCRSRVAAMDKPTRERCAGGKGIIVELGFDVENWFPLIKSCHDVAKSHTYYSKHIVLGAIIGGKVKRKTGRPQFSRGDGMFFKGFKPSISYSKKNQMSVFSNKLGRKYANKYLGSKKNFLARGHLAPDADFIFSAHQFSTFFYVNVAPQWQSINAGNWRRVEENIRKTAKNRNTDLEVVSGTEGVLKLFGYKGEKEIMLQVSRLPVPKHFWKVLRNPKDNSCIAFVSTNDPFLKEKPKTICQDICANHGWPLLQNDLSKGYVYCCLYQDLKAAIPEILDLTCKDVFKGFF